MSQFHWRPEEYLALMRAEVPEYERLQDEAAVATGYGAARVLELGTGTGETARRVLELHPLATLVGVDASSEMLERARLVLPVERVELRLGRLEEPLPEGPFDVLVSVLAVHHLDGAGKADLFTRARSVLAAGGRIVVGDVVVPEDPADAVTPIDGDYDKPSTVAEQLAWLSEAGFEARVVWQSRDLAVLAGDAP
ncbi:MAG TPA: class I SAM-dependent methyltransferase [Thermoleophilaceae bacterium]